MGTVFDYVCSLSGNGKIFIFFKRYQKLFERPVMSFQRAVKLRYGCKCHTTYSICSMAVFVVDRGTGGLTIETICDLINAKTVRGINRWNKQHTVSNN